MSDELAAVFIATFFNLAISIICAIIITGWIFGGTTKQIIIVGLLTFSIMEIISLCSIILEEW